MMYDEMMYVAMSDDGDDDCTVPVYSVHGKSRCTVQL